MLFYNLDKMDLLSLEYPCFGLTKSTWDDYGYKTTFILTYYETKSTVINIGSVKILDKSLEEPNLKPSQFRATIVDLPEKFIRLGNAYCSLGQSIDYYDNLSKFHLSDVIKTKLIDAFYDRELYEEFKNEKGFIKSLIRDSEPEKLARKGKMVQEEGFIFSYKTLLDGASDYHKLNFKLSSNRELPSRINILIGQNGVGKTQLLANHCK